MRIVTQSVLFVIALIIFGFFGVFTYAQESGFAQFELIPSKPSLVKNDKLTLDIFTISGDIKINAVEAHITYPAGKLALLEVNTDDSDFDIGIPEENNPGDLRISRGSSDGVDGKNLTASVAFLVQEPIQANEIQLSTDSVIMSADSNTNILSGSSVATVLPPQDEIPTSQVERKFPESFFAWVINLNTSLWEKILGWLE